MSYEGDNKLSSAWGNLVKTEHVIERTYINDKGQKVTERVKVRKIPAGGVYHQSADGDISVFSMSKVDVSKTSTSLDAILKSQNLN